MKTELALLVMNDGNPVMTLKQVAEQVLGISERTAENQIYREAFPLPAFKLGSKWMVHVSDVAQHIDKQRAAATELLQQQLHAA